MDIKVTWINSPVLRNFSWICGVNEIKILLGLRKCMSNTVVVMSCEVPSDMFSHIHDLLNNKITDHFGYSPRSRPRREKKKKRYELTER